MRLWGIRRPAAAIAAALALCLGASAPTLVTAATYDNTNPAATPCGNGTNAVHDWQETWITNSSGQRLALIEMRRSDYCNTVWTRVTNETGRGSGYASARSLTVSEVVAVYDCPATSCQVARLTSTDTLSAYGTTPYQGWSHQYTVPTTHALGSPPAIQAPGVESDASFTTGGLGYFGSTNLLSPWTDENNHHDVAGGVATCNNSSTDTCISWGLTSTGSYVTVYAQNDSSLANAKHWPNGPVDLAADFANVVRPLWNSAYAFNPAYIMCTGCAAGVYVKLLDLGTKVYSSTNEDINAPTVPAKFVQETIRMNSEVTWDHSCGTTDSGGCSGGSGIPFSCDSRVCLSHETGHSEGLGHCDIDKSVMCNVNYVVASTGYWTPQWTDIAALRQIYP